MWVILRVLCKLKTAHILQSKYQVLNQLNPQYRFSSNWVFLFPWTRQWSWNMTSYNRTNVWSHIYPYPSFLPWRTLNIVQVEQASLSDHWMLEEYQGFIDQGYWWIESIVPLFISSYFEFLDKEFQTRWL
jgi:hypothetical protein